MSSEPRFQSGDSDNVISLDNHRKSRKDIALEAYLSNNFSNPIFQLYISDLIIDHFHEWTNLESNILMLVYRKTISMATREWYIGAGEIANILGSDKRNIKRVRDKLEQDGWITIKETFYKNKIGLNLGKIMSLGGHKSEPVLHKKRGSETTPGGLKPPPSKSNTKELKESKICSTESRTTDTREKIVQRATSKKKKKLPRKSVGSLEQTWLCALNETTPYFTLLSLGDRRVKFYSLIGREASKGKEEVKGSWNGTTEDLHEFVRWTVLHWEYIGYRMSWLDKKPDDPNVGWFVKLASEIFKIWQEAKREDEFQVYSGEEPEIKTEKKKWYYPK